MSKHYLELVPAFTYSIGLDYTMFGELNEPVRESVIDYSALLEKLQRCY